MQIDLNGHAVIYSVGAKWSANPLLSDKERKRNRRQLGQALTRAQAQMPAFLHSSISHTRHIGGFALAKVPVGIDLEPASRRISARGTKWFTGPSELRAIKNPLYIWVMKEAAYKALRGPHQPSLIRQIAISPILSSQNKTIKFHFKLKGSSTRAALAGEGILKINSRTIMGIALATT